MSILNFKELGISRAGSQQGEDFEGLVREIGERLGLNPEWSGRGTDQGRDVFFTESREGTLGADQVRWLVNCKDFASSGRSVTEKDVGSVSDKLAQHGANGFLLATTTTASSGLKAMLDALPKQGAIKTKVWDRHELERILLKEGNRDLVRRYLPESHAALEPPISLPQIMEALRTLVPGPIYERIRTVIETYNVTDTWLTGESIWPHDAPSAQTIDHSIKELLEKNDPVEAAAALQNGVIEFEAFEATLSTLDTLRPSQAMALCEALIRAGDPNGSSLVAFRFYVDNYEPTNETQIALAVNLTGEDLHHLYAEEISVFISEDVTGNPAKHEAWSDLDALSSHTRITGVTTEQNVLWAHSSRKPKIEFLAQISIEVELGFAREHGGYSSFPGTAEGHIDAHGMYLERVRVDTKSYYE